MFVKECLYQSKTECVNNELRQVNWLTLIDNGHSEITCEWVTTKKFQKLLLYSEINLWDPMMEQKPIIILVEGNIGSGKTTLLKWVQNFESKRLRVFHWTNWLVERFWRSQCTRKLLQWFWQVVNEFPATCSVDHWWQIEWSERDQPYGTISDQFNENFCKETA